MKWIKLTDELPEHGQNIDLWLQPENGKGRRFNWTWEKQDSAAISINSIKATHWIAVGEPSDGNPDNSENANCAIFDVMQRAFYAGRERISHPDWDHVYDDFEDYWKEHGA